MLTIEDLKEMEPGHIIDSGIVINSPEGIYMTDNDFGKEMLWVAKRGRIHDWTIYIGWRERGFDSILSNGDNVISAPNIRKLVPCTNEALNMYRY